MNKVTQEEFDAFKLRVINAIMRDVDEYGTKNSNFEFHPTLYLKPYNKNYKIAPLPGQLFMDDDCKDLAVNLSREMIKLSESPMMSFVTEGYQAKISGDADLDDLPRPSQLPEDQRDEVIFLCFECKNLDQYCISFIKKYNNETRKWKLTPSNFGETKEHVKSSGRFSNFYNK
jgi:hypothetical protein